MLRFGFNLRHLCAINIACFGALGAGLAAAHEVEIKGKLKPLHANGHAPIGVMGDHRHKKGEWMVSYRYMDMEMEGNIQGDSSISPDEIVSNVVNPFSGPSKVRVVPTRMTSAMHMVSVMYAPADSITLMGMLRYIDRDMDHITYSGMMGTQRLGNFTTDSSGLGDTTVSAMIKLYDEENKKVHLNLGVSLPTGSIKEKDTVLTPSGMSMVLRMPYAMQLGSGTYDIEAGVTYSGKARSWSWGAQYIGTLRMGENDQHYTLGDIHKVSMWGGYEFIDWISTSARISYQYEQNIDGKDTFITAPVTTANPDNYGGEIVNLSFGVNLIGQSGAIRGHRVAMEYQVPIYQDVNGVQMEMKSMLTVGYQYAF